MFPGDQVLSQILEVLYECPLDPSQWERFLQLAAAATGGNAAAILMVDSSSAQSSVRAQWGLDPEATRQYERDYGAGGPWFHAVTRSPDWIGPSERFVPFAELQKTAFYSELIAPGDIPHAMLAMIEHSPSRAVNLSIYRNQRAGPFEESELDVVRFLKPHIQRAYKLYAELAAARNEKTGLQAALDTMTVGVILLDQGQHVITMNRTAQNMVMENDGLLATRDGLRACKTEESARLQKLIEDASLTSAGKGLKAGGAMNVSRSDRPPLHVLVSPMRRLNLDGRQSVRAIVLAADPTLRIRPAQKVMQFLFGLTPAESRVAALLADGQSPAEIAETLGVSRNTLKTQLASMYSKTGTSRQAQLVRLMLQISIHPSR